MARAQVIYIFMKKKIFTRLHSKKTQLGMPPQLTERFFNILRGMFLCHLIRNGCVQPVLKFVKKITRPNFRAKEFYTLKSRKSRLFWPAKNSKNASLSAIWPSFG